MEHQLKTAIFTLTGLEPEENSSPEKYNLKLGKVDPIVVGFFEAKRKSIPLWDLRYSALIAILKTICKMMEDNELILWLNKQG